MEHGNAFMVQGIILHGAVVLAIMIPLYLLFPLRPGRP